MESRSNDMVRAKMLQLLDFLRDLADGKEITISGSQLSEWILILEMLDSLLAHLDIKE